MAKPSPRKVRFIFPSKSDADKIELDQIDSESAGSDRKAKGVFNGEIAGILDSGSCSGRNRFYNFGYSKNDGPYGYYGSSVLLKLRISGICFLLPGQKYSSLRTGFLPVKLPYLPIVSAPKPPVRIVKQSRCAVSTGESIASIICNPLAKSRCSKRSETLMNKWTADQQKAISHRGNDILVTASAGTGKTAVLSGRCVDIVSDRSACPDVRSILVLTFTEAAAAEMKTRIGQALKDKYCQSRDSHLKRQLLLLDAAEISTIHSFCKRLITEYFYKLGIDPAFRVIDEDEQFLLKKQVCDEVVLEACEDSALAPAILDLLKGRSTNCNFLDLVIDIYNYLDSVVSRPKWFASAEEFSACVNPDLGLLGHKQRQIVKDKLDDCIKLLQYSIKLDGRLADGHWREQIEEDFLAEFNECSELIARGNFDEAADRIRKFAKPRNWNRKPEGLSDEIAELVKQPAAEALIIFKNLKHLAVINPSYLDIVSGSANRQTKTLLSFAKDLEQDTAVSRLSSIALILPTLSISPLSF